MKVQKKSIYEEFNEAWPFSSVYQDILVTSNNNNNNYYYNNNNNNNDNDNDNNNMGRLESFRHTWAEKSFFIFFLYAMFSSCVPVSNDISFPTFLRPSNVVGKLPNSESSGRPWTSQPGGRWRYGERYPWHEGTYLLVVLSLPKMR